MFVTLIICALISGASARQSVALKDDELSIPVGDRDTLVIPTTDAGCTIRINGDIGSVNTQPLYLVPDTEYFVEPNDKKGNINLHVGAAIEFHCTAGFQREEFPKKSVTAQCVSNHTYSYNGAVYDLGLFRCKKHSFHIARATEELCYDKGNIINIGFAVNSDRFLKVMEVCYDEINGRTHYVHHILTPAHEEFQHKVSRTKFIQGPFFKGRNMNRLYTVAMQRKTFGHILQSNSRVSEVIQNNTGKFLARGHLAPKADFLYGSQQRASFYFINVAPQWQTFNTGNWNRIETGIRKFVATRNLKLDIYSGVYGVASILDGNGDPRELYLDFNADGIARVPVPAIYYKILYERSTGAGVVLVGVNNIYASLEEIQKDYIYCDDVSDSIKWITWKGKRQDIQQGYSYACEGDDFSERVPHLPELNFTSLLV